MINESKPIINLPSEITRFDFTYIGHPEMNYYATAVYDENGTFIPYDIDENVLFFSSSFDQYETKTFRVYILDDEYYKNATYVTGTNELNQLIGPAKQIEVVHYGRFRKLKLTSYNIYKNRNIKHNNRPIRRYCPKKNKCCINKKTYTLPR